MRRLVVLAAAAAGPTVFGQACEPEWSRNFAVGEPHGISGTNVRCFRVYDDDGPGPRRPALYVGGQYEFMGGKRHNSISRWDGEQWENLGDGVRETSPFSNNGIVLTVTAWDEDGPGPIPESLVVGGDFFCAGGLLTSHVARWRNGSWVPMQVPLPNASQVEGLAAYDEDGPGPAHERLFAAGDFSAVGMYGGVARWTGSGWECVGGSIEPNCSLGHGRQLLVHDPDGPGPLPQSMFPAGVIATLGGQMLHGTIRWDGTQWFGMGDAGGGQLTVLGAADVDGPGPGPSRLYGAGSFLSISGVPFSRIAEWHGGTWNPVALGVNGGVQALAEYDADGDNPVPPELMATGNFTDASGVPVRHVARWNGISWQPAGTGVVAENSAYHPPIRGMQAFDSDGDGPSPNLLYAGGYIADAGGISVNDLATWNGSEWEAMGNGLTGQGVPPQPNNGLALVVQETTIPNGLPRSLYVGGRFQTAGRGSAANIARWDGERWWALGSGTNGSVNALAIHDADDAGPAPALLWAGGTFTSAGGNTVMRLSNWDGVQWGVPLNTGMDGNVYALLATDAVVENSLYAAGAFQWAGGTLAGRVARWDGTAWNALGSGTNGDVRTLFSYDADGSGPQQPVLLVGGSFSAAGGVTAANIAVWNGVSWSGLGGGTNSVVRDFEMFDDDGPGPGAARLFACGLFTQAGGSPASRVIRLDGSQWVQVGSGLPTEVYALHVFDPDGPGAFPTSLYAGGFFNDPNPNFVARWDGKAWSSLGAGMDAPVYNFATFADAPGGPPGLYMVGRFMSAGGLASGRIARWGCGDMPCYPDCDGDAALTLADFGCFQTKFALVDPYADCNGDGALNLADFGCFQTKFALGCP